MAVVVKHALVSVTPDDPAYEIRPSHWNDSHVVTGLGTLATLNLVDLTANVTGILPLANGGTNSNATPGAGRVIYSDGTKMTSDANLTWSAATGLLSQKGISSKGSANGIGTELFGLGASDAGTSATTNNTVVGKGASIGQTYITESIVIGANASLNANFGIVIGAGSSSTGGADVIIGRALTNSAQGMVAVGSSNSGSNDALLALGSTNIAQHQDAGCLGWGAISQQNGELSWGARRNASGASSFRIFGCTSSGFVAGDMSRINCLWIDATPATKKVRTILSTYDTAEREFMRADANGTDVDVMLKNRVKIGDTTAATAILHLIAGTATANRAPKKFTLPGVVLTTPEAGAMETDAERLYYTPTSLIREALVGCIFTQTADKTVSNTVTETSIVGTGVGYGLTLPANFFVAGKTIRLRIGGIYTTPALATPSVTVKIKYGATVLATVATSSLLSGATNLEFDGEIDITCRTTGATGTVSMHGDIEYSTGVAGTIAVDPLNNAGATKAIDTTTANLLDVTVTWDAATTTRSATSTVCTVEVLN